MYFCVMWMPWRVLFYVVNSWCRCMLGICRLFWFRAWGSLWFHARRVWQSNAVSEYQCTEALLNWRVWQRRARWAQELESSTQRKTSSLLNTLEARLYMETQLQTESLRSSIELCQVGIEHMHRFAFRITLLWVQGEPESLRILRALPSGHWEGA